MANDWTDRLYVKQYEIEGPWGTINPTALLGYHLGWACGPASLFTCFKLLGNWEATPNKVFEAIGVSFGQQIPDWLKLGGGADEDQLARGAKRLGYKAEIRQFQPGARRKAWEHLIGCSHRHIPAILGVDDGEHWIVGYGADKGGAWIMDPADDESIFEYWDKAALMDRWLYCADPEEDEDGGDCAGFGLLTITPSKPKTQEAQRRYGCPPGDFLLSWIGDEDDSAELIELREDLDTIFSDIPQRGGQRAIDFFAGRLETDICKTIRNWCADSDKRWVRERLDLIHDLLRHLPYRVSPSHESRLAVELATMVTTEALVAAEVDPGDGDPDEVLTYEEDAAAIFSKRGDGKPAHEFLARYQDLLAERVSSWSEYSTPASVRGHLRCLLGEAASNELRVRRGHELKTLAEVAVLLTIYEWLV